MLGSRRATVAVLAALTLVAGCIGTTDQEDEGIDPQGEAPDESTDGAGTDEEQPPEPAPETYRLEDHYTAEALNLGADAAERSLDVPVPAEASELVLELRWTGDNVFELYGLPPGFCHDFVPGADLGHAEGTACRVAFYLGYDERAYEASGNDELPEDTYLRLSIEEGTLAEECDDRDDCTWYAFANPKLAVDAEITMVASVFTEAAPDGYSAFDDANAS